MTRARASGLLSVVPLYVALTFAAGFVDYQIRPRPNYAVETYVPAVFAGTAEPPGRYRVLSPYAFELLRQITGLSPVYAWLAFRWLGLLLSLLASHFYLTRWFTHGQAAAGGFLLAGLLPLTLTNAWPIPEQFVDLLLFTTGLALVARGHRRLFAVVLLLNALNRETSAFLWLMFVLASPIRKGHALWSASLGVLWLIVTAGLRVWRGWVPYNPWQLVQNWGYLTPLPADFPPYYRIYGWFFLILLVPLFWSASRSWAIQPRFVRVALAIVAPAFTVVACLFSSTIESRIFTPLLPLLIPGVLFSMFSETDRPDVPLFQHS